MGLAIVHLIQCVLTGEGSPLCPNIDKHHFHIQIGRLPVPVNWALN